MADMDGTTFLTGANAGFIAELYTRFLEDPAAVDESWRRFFSQMDDDLSAVLPETHGPSWGNPAPRIITNGAAAPAKSMLRNCRTGQARGLKAHRAQSTPSAR